MGSYMSVMGKGMQYTQMVNFLMGTVHKQFSDKEINNFDDFHALILDIFNNFNSALPGKHYDTPTRKEIEVYVKATQACFTKWKDAKESEKRKIFIEFMKENTKLSKLDDSSLITALVTPPAAMAAKRAGENIPQLKLIKAIPDVIFVPSAAVLALIYAKLSKRMLLGNLAHP